MIVDLQEMKDWLKVQHDEEDVLITGLLEQATAIAEDFCHVSFELPAPQPVQLAVKLLVSYFYDQRDAAQKEPYQTVMACARALLSSYQDPEMMF